MDYLHKLKATLVFSKNSSYKLGDFLNFDSILDDLNGNVSLNPSEYKAALSGYYDFSLKLAPQNFLPSGQPPVGSLFSNLQLYVNGKLVRESFYQWPSLSVADKNGLSGLISLKMDDVVSMKYRLFSL